jgi:hypothetical protein
MTGTSRIGSSASWPGPLTACWAWRRKCAAAHPALEEAGVAETAAVIEAGKLQPRETRLIEELAWATHPLGRALHRACAGLEGVRVAG